MINLVVPMAGAGSRFAKNGYKLPKPFIDVKGKMMIERVLDGLKINNAHYTLIIRKEFLDCNKEQLDKITKNYPVAYVTVDRVTAGASCTVMAAMEVINNSYPLVIADSDNIFDEGVIQSFVEDCMYRKLDGSLVTFKSNDQCFSYTQTDDSEILIKTAEKEVISEHAIAGAYMFRQGRKFVECTLDMLIYGDKTQNEFYLSNVYNYAVMNNLKCGIFEIKNKQFKCVGTPFLLKENYG